MRAAALTAALCVTIAGISPTSEARAADRERTDIPAQDLVSALKVLEEQRDLHVVFLAEDLRSLRTRGAAGELTTDEALRQLLNGTGLTYRFLHDDTVSVLPETVPSRTKEAKEVRISFGRDGAALTRLAQSDSASPRTAAPQSSSQSVVEPASGQKQDVRVKDGESLESVTVTGSRLRGVTRDVATNVTAIDAGALDERGYRNVFDALSSLPQNTGFTTGADFGNTFTPAANTISLRGLGPNHTLVLVNGRRVADYPIAYDGSVNFVNLATVPSAAIQRIEVLNNGASAIYGSDAIAGVVNMILKEDVDGVDLDFKAGTTDRGGGDNWRLQAVGGHQFDRLSVMVAAELSKTDPIWSRERDFMSSTTLQGARATNIWSIMDLDTGRYADPTAACAALSNNFDGSVAVTRAARASQGSFCGSGKAQPMYWTVRTGNESQNLYAALRFDLNDNATVYVDAIAGFNRTENNTRGPNWTSAAADGSFFFNQNTGHYETWTRRIAPEEIGGVERFNRIWRDRSLDGAVGVKGELGSGDWTYDASYSASSYLSRNRRPRLLVGVDSFFLGPKLGEDPDGIPIYAPDSAKFAQPVSPDAFDTIIGRSESRDSASLQTVSLTANGTAFELPAGPLKTAVVLEWGTQKFENRPDARVNQGLYFNSPPVDTVNGSRDRYAAALEINIPIVARVNATLAGRYDNYSFADGGDSKLTYNLGLTYRPVDSLLLRGSYATSFRAPDMNYIYQTQIRGFYASSTDYYRCATAGQPLDDCEFAEMSPGANFTSNGNDDLKFENGTSFSYGLVWSPLSDLSVSVDYWSIKIDDLVTVIDSDFLLRMEADCRLGERDINSAQCTDALARVRRNAPDAPLNPGAISMIFVNPINAALDRTSGFDVTTHAAWQLGAHDFVWTVNYSRVLKHENQQFDGDPVRDLLTDFTNSDWRNKLNTDLTWSLGKWSSTVQGTRYGRIPNSAQDDYVSPTWLANVSARYQFMETASASIIVQNVFDKIKSDTTTGWPFYPTSSYMPYGREVWLQFNYHVGH